jgi:hypothetical protein
MNKVIEQKKNLLIIILSFFVSHYLVGMGEPPQKEHIVIDLIFLVQPDILAGIQSLGALTLCKAWFGSFLGGHDPQKIQDDFFALLKEIDPAEPPEKIFYQASIAPTLLYSFLIGKKTPEESLARFNDYITDPRHQRGFDPTLMARCAEMTFDPEKNTAVMKVVPGAVALLQHLRASGHTIHLVGNWNAALFAKLEEKFPQLALINGQRIISGHHNKAKGSALFAKLFETTSPEQTIIIEPYPEIASELQRRFPGITLIPCQNSHDLSAVKKALRL